MSKSAKVVLEPISKLFEEDNQILFSILSLLLFAEGDRRFPLSVRCTSRSKCSAMTRNSVAISIKAMFA